MEEDITCLEMENTEEVPCEIAAACSLLYFCLFGDGGDIQQFFAEDDDDDEEDSDSELSPPQATAKRNLMVQYLQQL